MPSRVDALRPLRSPAVILVAALVGFGAAFAVGSASKSPRAASPAATSAFTPAAVVRTPHPRIGSARASTAIPGLKPAATAASPAPPVAPTPHVTTATAPAPATTPQPTPGPTGGGGGGAAPGGGGGG